METFHSQRVYWEGKKERDYLIQVFYEHREQADEFVWKYYHKYQLKTNYFTQGPQSKWSFNINP